ncbi:hypothetical protein SAMN05421858_5086 [Haladaptatus litoreus]|uniref:DUF1059 domain-containing protein n=1 Tax=Haladaptatus litoreus TaxID=553468 RepID=A0A1N7FIE0_9EURY|nr:hypothetical protein [Haladaptatus litoreus]SIR99996.1 hypothetical protein SAMN05421858_5086 [Haladaptatus litoreus]
MSDYSAHCQQCMWHVDGEESDVRDMAKSHRQGVGHVVGVFNGQPGSGN